MYPQTDFAKHKTINSKNRDGKARVSKTDLL